MDSHTDNKNECDELPFDFFRTDETLRSITDRLANGEYEILRRSPFGIDIGTAGEALATGYDRVVCHLRIDIKNKTLSIREAFGEEPERWRLSDQEVQDAGIALAKTDFPQHVLTRTLDGLALAETHPKEDIYIYYSGPGSDEIHTVKFRFPKVVDGVVVGKYFLPFSLWTWKNEAGQTEQRWLKTEGPNLPLFNVREVKDHSSAVLVEGEKVARWLHSVLNPKTAEEKRIAALFPADHPFKHSAVLGYAGANRIRTHDLAILKGLSSVIIVPDGDETARDSVPDLAEVIKAPTSVVYFPSNWGAGFDFADWEDENHRARVYNVDGEYVGQDFRDMMRPATWLTDQFRITEKRNGHSLRRWAQGEWIFLPDVGKYVNRRFPSIMYDEDTLNTVLRPYSHVPNVSKLIDKFGHVNPVDASGYNPGKRSGEIYTDQRGRRLFNLFQPSSVRQLDPNKFNAADAAPFIEFLEYLLPVEKDRAEAIRWIRTLVCRPAVRMKYSLLLLSEAQGTGKNTLLEHIVRPLVGESNVSMPDTKQLSAEFNAGWLMNKRLAIVAELYANRNWDLMNSLKTLLTDSTKGVTPKFQETRDIELWFVMAAASNHLGAAAINDDDRRWLIPTVTEEVWPQTKFEEFYDWLNNRNGLRKIRTWLELAEKYEIVSPAERAPKTDARSTAIAENQSPEEEDLRELFKRMKASERPVSIGASNIAAWISQKHSRPNPHWTQPRNVINLATRDGLSVTDERLSTTDTNQKYIFNRKVMDVAEIKRCRIYYAGDLMTAA